MFAVLTILCLLWKAIEVLPSEWFVYWHVEYGVGSGIVNILAGNGVKIEKLVKLFCKLCSVVWKLNTYVQMVVIDNLKNYKAVSWFQIRDFSFTQIKNFSMEIDLWILLTGMQSAEAKCVCRNIVTGLHSVETRICRMGFSCTV